MAGFCSCYLWLCSIDLRLLKVLPNLETTRKFAEGAATSGSVSIFSLTKCNV
jgi:hypothetical protein